MGVDIYLHSLFKTFEENQDRTPLMLLEGESPIDFANRAFDAMRATGGYFRNGYNSGDVMWAMGSSWENVYAMRDDNRYLPIARARELIEAIEARPLTRERVAAHIFKHMSSGKREHPMTGRMHEMMEAAAVNVAVEALPPLPPADIDTHFAFLNTRRDQLLAILRKSIELNEPLEIT